MLESFEHISSQLEGNSIAQLKFEIEKIVTKLGIADLKPYLIAPSAGQPYGRKLVFQSATLEVLVMCWSSDQDSLPHNHGFSAGWAYIVCGTSRHCTYQFKRNRLLSGAESFLHAGELTFFPQGLVHSMGNCTKDPLITVHFYSPPIARMKVFSSDTVYVVADDCGAWQPQPSQVLKRVELSPLET